MLLNKLFCSLFSTRDKVKKGSKKSNFKAVNQHYALKFERKTAQELIIGDKSPREARDKREKKIGFLID